MGKNVDANGRSILHKGHGGTHSAAPPDVCKTPSPGGPIPIPYPNIAMDSNIADGAETVKIEGNPIANVAAKISTSTGDEAGSAGGGIMSSKIKGTVTWKMGSPDVKAEGKSVVRFLDTTFHNGNAFNTSFVDDGGSGVGYANDFIGLCPLCNGSPEDHQVGSLPSSAALCADIIRELHETSKKKKGGFMVGAMIAECGRKFGAKSGGQMESFDAAVTRAGAKPLKTGGPATFDQTVAANTSKTATNIKDNIFGAWVNAERAFDKNEKGYNFPGGCAGAKLLANSGHKPKEMTEMWFQPKDLPPVMLGPYRGISDGLRTEDKSYSSAGDIGSCNTCQDILYMTMCPERTC